MSLLNKISPGQFMGTRIKPASYSRFLFFVALLLFSAGATGCFLIPGSQIGTLPDREAPERRSLKQNTQHSEDTDDEQQKEPDENKYPDRITKINTQKPDQAVLVQGHYAVLTLNRKLPERFRETRRTGKMEIKLFDETHPVIWVRGKDVLFRVSSNVTGTVPIRFRWKENDEWNELGGEDVTVREQEKKPAELSRNVRRLQPGNFETEVGFRSGNIKIGKRRPWFAIITTPMNLRFSGDASDRLIRDVSFKADRAVVRVKPIMKPVARRNHPDEEFRFPIVKDGTLYEARFRKASSPLSLMFQSQTDPDVYGYVRNVEHEMVRQFNQRKARSLGVFYTEVDQVIGGVSRRKIYGDNNHFLAMGWMLSEEMDIADGDAHRGDQLVGMTVGLGTRLLDSWEPGKGSIYSRGDWGSWYLDGTLSVDLHTSSGEWGWGGTPSVSAGFETRWGLSLELVGRYTWLVDDLGDVDEIGYVGFGMVWD